MGNLAARTKSTRLIMRICCLLFDFQPSAETQRQAEPSAVEVHKELVDVRVTDPALILSRQGSVRLTGHHYLCFGVFITTSLMPLSLGESIMF